MLVGVVKQAAMVHLACIGDASLQRSVCGFASHAQLSLWTSTGIMLIRAPVTTPQSTECGCRPSAMFSEPCETNLKQFYPWSRPVEEVP